MHYLNHSLFEFDKQKRMTSKVLIYFAILILSLSPSLSGQTLLKDVEDLMPGSGSSPNNWSAVSNDLFIFEGINALQSQFLFASDGTEAGTIGLGTYQVDTDIIQFGNKAYFGGCNLFLSADSCTSLYVSDGTVAGTTFFFDLVPGGLSLGIEDIVAGDSLFFFSGHTIETGYELWRSNGTAVGTYRIDDIASGTTSGYVSELAVIDDIAYFAGHTDEFGIEAWRSDGTSAGTYMIADLNEGSADGFPSGFTASGGFIYFSGLGTNTGFEVRRTNGEEGNIALIGEMGTTDSSWPRDFVDADGRLYYVAEGNDEAGFDLFVYDHVGDPLHLDFMSGDIFPRALMPFGDGEVIFNATNESGRELWRSNGTLAGTQMITDLYPGEMDGVFGTGAPGESFYVWEDSLVYFAGADGINAAGEFVYELFVSDGTEAGTQLISDQFPGTEGSNPGNFFEFGDRLYFAATDPVFGREPYYLDFGIISATAQANNDLSITQLPFPNPLPDEMPIHTTIQLAKGTKIYAQLFDLKGTQVQGIQDLGYFPAGRHALQIPLGDYPSGLYQLVLNGGTLNQISIPIVLE